MMITVRTGIWMVAAWSVLGLASCDQHPEIEISQVRENGAPVEIGVATRERFHFAEDRGSRSAEDRGSKSAEQTVAGLLVWKLPDGWEKLPSRPMRIVNMRAGEAECYVTYLSAGTAAGNINRWRGQMSLPPASDADVAAMRKGKLLDRDAHRVDMTGALASRSGEPKPNQRVLAVYAQFPGFAISVKMLGPKAAVDAAAVGFDEFCASLAFKGGFGEATAKAPGAAAHGGSGRPALAWDVPDGWTESPGHRMRHVTFATVGTTSCWITFLGRAAGTWAENVRRWQGMIGEAALAPSALAALPKVSLFDKPVALLASYGKTTGVLGVMAVLPDANMFVKLTGPNAEVKAQRAKFEAFCESLRFEK